MPYNKLLKRIIANTDYTQQQVAEKCTDLGIPISRSYINKLEGNKSPAPKEEVSRAIAKVCNVDERLLVLEGYLDKAPKEIKDFFISLKKMASCLSTNLFTNTFDNTAMNCIEEQIENEPLSDFIISIIEYMNICATPTENGLELKEKNDNIIFNLTKPYFLKCEDNAMYPVIKEDDEVMLDMKKQYENGDIVMVKIEPQNRRVIRQIMFLGRDIQLIPLNKKYHTEIYNRKDVVIIGKINKIITKI